jgi:hypothetical protein
VDEALATEALAVPDLVVALLLVAEVPTEAAATGEVWAEAEEVVDKDLQDLEVGEHLEGAVVAGLRRSSCLAGPPPSTPTSPRLSNSCNASGPCHDLPLIPFVLDMALSGLP